MFKQFYLSFIFIFLLSASTFNPVPAQKNTLLVCKNTISLETSDDLDLIISLCANKNLKRIPNAMEGNAESALKSCNLKQFYIVFDQAMRQNNELLKPINHRAIGVVYNPATEQLYNYVPTVLPLRYDILFFIKTTSSLEPISLF